MRHRFIASALLVALALACAATANAGTWTASGRDPALGAASGIEQAALIPSKPRDPRIAGRVEGRLPRAPHSLATAWVLPAPGVGLAAPRPSSLGLPSAAPGPEIRAAYGSARTSRGPPYPTPVVS